MSKLATAPKLQPAVIDIDQAADYIITVQKPSGEIPWSVGGHTDPWDHVESAMGLAVAGRLRESELAYEWLANTQMSDGSWWAQYRDGEMDEGTFKDTNMVAYIAVGVLHHFLCTGDMDFVRQIWPTVEKAMEFVLSMAEPHGAYYWAKRQDDSLDTSILLTGCSSIYKSFEAALRLASLLGHDRPKWREAMDALDKAINTKPHIFDKSKLRYSMDWYYPILCGVTTGSDAARRIDAYWGNYVIKEWGVRCVSDQEWVTMAETSELVMSLAAMGRYSEAEMILGWIQDNKFDDGAYYTGLTLPDEQIYTMEKTSWTGAAVILAADMLYEISPASRLFMHPGV